MEGHDVEETEENKVGVMVAETHPDTVTEELDAEETEGLGVKDWPPVNVIELLPLELTERDMAGDGEWVEVKEEEPQEEALGEED